MFRWVMAEAYGYKPKTTFWSDFSIADVFGEHAVRDTWARAVSEWKHDYVYLTELVMVLNHKIWQHYSHNEALAKVYDELWKETAKWAEEHLKGEELSYYYRTID